MTEPSLPAAERRPAPVSSDVSFVVPSYGRPEALRDCLTRLKSLSTYPHEIVVVVRDVDLDTRAVAEEFGVTVRSVVAPGMIAALLAGFAAVGGGVVAVLDDDTVPETDWLDKCLVHLNDPDVGMVGGRDRVYLGPGAVPLGGRPGPVGLLRGWGDLVGNHHSGRGVARAVDHLKGCNFIVRSECLQREFAALEALKGQGAQVATDTAICLSVRSAGWGLVYDPRAQVAHYPAVRAAGDHRDSVQPGHVYNACHNDTLIRLAFVPAAWLPVAMVVAFVMGTGTAPGLLRLGLATLKRRHPAWTAAIRGVLAGLLATPALRRQVQEEARSAVHPPAVAALG